MVNDMGLGGWNSLMALASRVNGLTIKLLAMASLFMLMEMFMKAIGKMIE
jgi:hypothetical protein